MHPADQLHWDLYSKQNGYHCEIAVSQSLIFIFKKHTREKLGTKDIQIQYWLEDQGRKEISSYPLAHTKLNNKPKKCLTTCLAVLRQCSAYASLGKASRLCTAGLQLKQ